MISHCTLTREATFALCTWRVQQRIFVHDLYMFNRGMNTRLYGYELKSRLRSDHRWATNEASWPKRVWLAIWNKSDLFRFSALADRWRYALVLDVRRGLSSDSATDLNRKGLHKYVPWREYLFYRLFSCLFCVCKQLLKGIVYPLAVKSTPRSGSGSPKGAVRSSRLLYILVTVTLLLIGSYDHQDECVRRIRFAYLI